MRSSHQTPGRLPSPDTHPRATWYALPGVLIGLALVCAGHAAMKWAYARALDAGERASNSLDELLHQVRHLSTYGAGNSVPEHAHDPVRATVHHADVAVPLALAALLAAAALVGFVVIGLLRARGRRGTTKVRPNVVTM